MSARPAWVGGPGAVACARGVRDERAERLVLCGMLKEPELVMPRLAEMGLEAADFAHHAHGLVFESLTELAGTGDGAVGPYRLWEWLRARGELAELGADPAAWIADVWGEDPTGAWAVPAACEVRRLAVRRRAVAWAWELISDAAAGRMSPDDPRLAAACQGA